MKRFLVFFGLLVFLIALPFGVAFTYQITRFPAGENQYTLSEPTIDWTIFRGRSVPLLVTDDFVIVAFEGSDPGQDNWVTMFIYGTREPPDSFILAVTIHENVKSGDPAKMKTTTFYHKSLLETGKADFKLVIMDPEPDLKKFIDGQIAKEKIKNRSI